MTDSNQIEPIFQTKAEIVDNRELASGLYWMDLLAPDIVAHARPGQFVHIVVSDTTDHGHRSAWLRHTPLLRRPFSVAEIDVDTGVLGIIYRVLGGGTEVLAGRKSGEFIDVLGPMGATFEPIVEGRSALMVAGGVGIAPFFFLVQEAMRSGSVNPESISVFFGASSADLLSGHEKLKKHGINLSLATDDGSLGHKGFVTELLIEELNHRPERCDFLYACGPTPMMKGTQTIAGNFNRPGQVSLEGIMPCGVGVCMACVVPCRKPGSDVYRYERVCHNGPVFDIQEVIFQ